MRKEKLEKEIRVNQAVLIEFEGERGIVFKIGETLSATWQSGEIIVFWEDGEQTILPDKFDVVNFNVFNVVSSPRKQ